MKKSRLSGSTKLLLAILAIAGLVIAYITLIYNPTDQEMEQLSSDILTTQGNIDTLKAQIQSLYDKQKIVDVGKQSGSSVQPYDRSLDEFKYLSDIIASHDPTYHISFSDPRANKGASFARRSVNITFSVTGYTDARAVIDALDRSPYRTYIGDLTIRDTNFTLAPSKGYSESDPMSVTMTMTFIEDCRANKTGIIMGK